jgi:hypothetical protein
MSETNKLDDEVSLLMARHDLERTYAAILQVPTLVQLLPRQEALLERLVALSRQMVEGMARIEGLLDEHTRILGSLLEAVQQKNRVKPAE